MGRHSASEEPVTAPLLLRPRAGSALLLPDAGQLLPPVRSGDAALSRGRVRTWLRGGVVAAAVASSGLLGGYTALSLAAPPGPPTTTAQTTTPPGPASAPPSQLRAEAAERQTATTPVRDQKGSATRSTRSEEKSKKPASRANREKRSNKVRSASPVSGVGQKKSGNTPRGDGCGPYEHKLSTGYCSPDVGVMDDDGNLDPSRAVVPGNLR